MDYSIDQIASYLYDNPAIGVAVSVATFFLIGYILKKLKTIIVVLVILAFIVGFYVYNRGSIEDFSRDGIKAVKDIDPQEVKKKAEDITDESRSKFFETFGKD